MAGDWHEVIAKLIMDEPGVSWELFEIGRERAVPVCTDAWHHSGVRGSPVRSELLVGASTRAESIGAPILKERRADRVVRLGFEDDSAMMVLCEVQSVWKDDKALRLPGYVARVHEDYGLPAELVMICRTDALASRYREGLWLGAHSVVTPMAIGPSDLAPIDDPEAFGRSLQLQVMTMVMRRMPRDAGELSKLMAVLKEGLETTSPTLAEDYAYYLSKLKGEEFTVVMEETMNREAEPEWWRRTKARMAGEGREDALAEGLEQGLEQGLERGLEQGRREELRRQRAGLIGLLAARSIQTDYNAVSRIESCEDPEVLAAWTQRVVVVDRVEELFED